MGIEDGFEETEIGPIPVDWDVVRFDHCIYDKPTSVGKIKTSDYKPLGRYPVIDQSQNYIAGYHDDESLVYQGELPVVIFGDHTRVFKLVDFPFICGADGVKILLPNQFIVDSQFFYYALTSLDIPSRGYNRHYKLLKEQKIPLPPLPEQRRIAHVLSTIQREIAAQDALITAAREVKRSLMQRLFTYGPGAEPAPTKQTEIGEIPEHWGVVPLESLFEIQLGKMLSKSARQGISPRPYLRNANVQWGYIDLKDLSEMDFNARELEKFRLHRDDILVCEGGEIGRTAIWEEQIQECYYQKAIHRLRPRNQTSRQDSFFTI